jgi:isocitrate/isopropylmalate dehydrogenase
VWRIAVLGRGPIASARRALEAVAEVEVADDPAGCEAVLSDRPLPDLARELGHHARLLAVRPLLLEASPLRRPRIAPTDLLLVRGDARFAFEAAERRSGRLAAVGSVEPLAREHPDVTVERLGVGEAAARLVADPSSFDVLACDEPVLADVAAAITGTPWMVPSATLGPPGIFSPLAPSGAGDTANPLSMILAAALMLRVAFGADAEAERLEVAVDLALETGLRTPDIVLGAVGERRAGTEALASAVLTGLRRA